jgi:hypothetical protein
MNAGWIILGWFRMQPHPLQLDVSSEVYCWLAVSRSLLSSESASGPRR